MRAPCTLRAAEARVLLRGVDLLERFHDLPRPTLRMLRACAVDRYAPGDAYAVALAVVEALKPPPRPRRRAPRELGGDPC